MTTIIRYIETEDHAKYFDTNFLLEVDHSLVKSQLGRLARKRENQMWTFAATKDELVAIENLEPKTITIDGNDINFDSESDDLEIFEVHPAPWVNLKIGKNFNGRPKVANPRFQRCTIHPSQEMIDYLSHYLGCKISGSLLYTLIKAGINHKGSERVPKSLKGKKAHDFSVRVTDSEFQAVKALRLPNESNLQLTLRLIYTGVYKNNL